MSSSSFGVLLGFFDSFLRFFLPVSASSAFFGFFSLSIFSCDSLESVRLQRVNRLDEAGPVRKRLTLRSSFEMETVFYEEGSGSHPKYRLKFGYVPILLEASQPVLVRCQTLLTLKQQAGTAGHRLRDRYSQRLQTLGRKSSPHKELATQS